MIKWAKRRFSPLGKVNAQPEEIEQVNQGRNFEANRSQPTSENLMEVLVNLEPIGKGTKDEEEQRQTKEQNS